MSRAHWSDKYVGMTYVAGEFDCADLAALVAREVLGKPVRLPSEHGASPFARNAAIAAHQCDFAAPVSAPRDGDLVLLKVRARAQHIGIVCVIGGERWVLHNCQWKDEGPGGEALGGVMRVPERALERLGYSVEGYYRWI